LLYTAYQIHPKKQAFQPAFDVYRSFKKPKDNIPKLALFGFVFSYPKGWLIDIIPFHIRFYANYADGKLALFFQVASF